MREPSFSGRGDFTGASNKLENIPKFARLLKSTALCDRKQPDEELGSESVSSTTASYLLSCLLCQWSCVGSSWNQHGSESGFKPSAVARVDPYSPKIATDSEKIW
jgi:hypothetical protein